MAIKCFILILSFFASIEVRAQFQPTITNHFIKEAYKINSANKSAPQAYGFEHGKAVDRRNQFITGREMKYALVESEARMGFTRGNKKESHIVELSQKVTITCVHPGLNFLPSEKEGVIEAIRAIGPDTYLKVSGCNYLVKSDNVIKVENRPAGVDKMRIQQLKAAAHAQARN